MTTGRGSTGVSRRQALMLIGVGGLGVALHESTSPTAAFQGRPALATAPPIPRGTVIRTILKDVPPESVGPGAILVHDHINQDLRLGTGPNARHFQTPSIDEVVRVLTSDVKDGVSCIVDAGHPDMGTDWAALKQIATRVPGMQIVASAGYYQQGTYPADIAQKSEDQIADDLVRDTQRNNLGAFGEIGQASGHMTTDERKVFRAVGKAHVRTGLPIRTHNAYGGQQSVIDTALRQLDVLESAGVSPAHVAIGHVDSLNQPTVDIAKELARRGAFVAFDRATLESGVNDQLRLMMVLAFLDAGYANHLVLSSDFIGDEQLAGQRERPSDPPKVRSVNGRPPGWARTVTVFVPMMRKAGVDEATVRTILVDNPRRLLACVPKFPRAA